MSHFVVALITSDTELVDDYMNEVVELMEPYNGNTEVEPY